jgi:hypothetical protein
MPHNQLKIIAFVGFLSVLCLVLLKPKIEEFATNYLMTELVLNGAETEAIVVKREINKRAQKDSTGLVRIDLAIARKKHGRIHYEFLAQDGKVRVGMDDVEAPVFEKYTEGSRIPIYYFRKFPFLNKVKDNIKSKQAPGTLVINEKDV